MSFLGNLVRGFCTRQGSWWLEQFPAFFLSAFKCFFFSVSGELEERGLKNM